jgi:hypothetical protein
MQHITTGFRRALLASAAVFILGAVMATSASAQIRQKIADDVASKAGHAFVTKIQGQSCSDFAATMAQMKSKSADSSGGMSSKLKQNVEARTTFVNIVAAPLLNKLIDCNMLPGGM